MHDRPGWLRIILWHARVLAARATTDLLTYAGERARLDTRLTSKQALQKPAAVIVV
jgi:hypothetical protein